MRGFPTLVFSLYALATGKKILKTAKPSVCVLQRLKERNPSASPPGLSSYSFHSFILSRREEAQNGYTFPTFHPCNHI